MPEKARGPWCRGGRGRGPEVGAGQALPLSKMMAATVPLQALYGEVWSTRRSKPALTTAAQRCSWVRMFSAQWGEGGGGDPVDCAPPFTPGLGSTGAHLPTLRGATGGLLGVFGDSGTKTRGSVIMHTRAGLPACPLSWKPRSFLGGNGGRNHLPATPNCWAAPPALPATPGVDSSQLTAPPPQLPVGEVLMTRWSLR